MITVSPANGSLWRQPPPCPTRLQLSASLQLLAIGSPACIFRFREFLFVSNRVRDRSCRWPDESGNARKWGRNMKKITEPTDASIDALFDQAAVIHRRSFLTAGAAAMAMCMGANASFAQDAVKAKASSLVAPTEQDRAFMKQAITLMRQAGVVEKTGGPFGAVIVRNGEVLGASGNSVLRDNDPSAHAEVNAIRIACKKVGAPNLKGSTLFSSCEPCPMCYSTAYWARIDRIYYAAAWTDYADLFDDSNINADLKLAYAERKVPVAQMMQSDAQQVWADYRKLPEKTRY